MMEQKWIVTPRILYQIGQLTGLNIKSGLSSIVLRIRKTPTRKTGAEHGTVRYGDCGTAVKGGSGAVPIKCCKVPREGIK